jgi:hypothetical protein
MTTVDASNNIAGPQDSLRGFPLPGTAASVVAAAAPGHGPGTGLVRRVRRSTRTTRSSSATASATVTMAKLRP